MRDTIEEVARQSGSLAVLRFQADLTTPVRAFLALTRPGEDAFLLESVAGGETQARYSFLGLEPSDFFRAECDDRGESSDIDPRAAFAQWLARAPAPRLEELSLPFVGAAVGWMDFSSMEYAEPVLKGAFRHARSPRIVFARFATGLIFDHLRQEGYLYRRATGDPREADPSARLEQLRERLSNAVPPRRRSGTWRARRQPERDRFERNVGIIGEAIRAGDAYQIVLSEPYEGGFSGDPFEVYRSLRRLNPSPYHFYVSLGDRQIVGASPEMLVRVESQRVMTIPIAGTRPRGATPEEDVVLERALLADPKEMAEHAMLVDLARNDLGRVCTYGSVSVPVRGVVERFSHVMHMISEVHGELAPSRTALDALWSTFPAGTVSGTPKIRAVEILSELEGEDRGVYGGAIGLADSAGNIETCIAIRTLEFEQGLVRFRTGAGIVADSRADAEWEEIYHKAAVLLEALAGDDSSHS